MEHSKPVLIMGGSGQAGAEAAAVLRRWYPTLPLTIAGRDLDRARRVADELGAATAVTIDLRRGDLGLPAGHDHSAVVAALWDSHLHGLRYAQDRGLPYLSLSSGLTDIAPEVVAGGQRAGAAPILLASHWYAGVIVLATLDLAREFGRIDTIRVGAVLDESDVGGPAATADMERLMAATSAGLVRRDGVFSWVGDPGTQVEVSSVDGTVLPGRLIPTLDVPSLAVATGAPNVRFAFAVGESAGRRRGGPASTEVGIDLEGEDHTGAPLSRSRRLIHPAGQNPLTALGVALGVERLLGLRGEAVAPGIHTPEALIDPAYAVERMVEIGATFADAPGDR
ncbi:hypothetical protein OG339_17365 [Streptosporangium sp. NBC_01495]|uniref:hypothetical protein n=1 Tax=Streptosporangium sp. NBC_01495 TaxID=2903899 RepID=UPI002E37D322|nr:hypothetical protein [Streptosporangium sp. NBC_01495]